MRVGLNISTYHSPAELALVLASVAEQSRVPDQVLVLEDGDSDDTRRVVEEAEGTIKNLSYVGQEDRGFRLARIRNLGILHSTADYLISIDGDMILHERFVADHLEFAEPGFYTQGGRQCLSRGLTEKLILEGRKPRDYERLGFGRHSDNKSVIAGVRIPVLSRLLSPKCESPRKTSGCNQGFYRRDLVDVNGFDNSFVGWGEEDYDLIRRLFANGIRERLVKCAAVAWHLHHPKRERENKRTAEVPPVRVRDGLRELAAQLGMGVDG